MYDTYYGDSSSPSSRLPNIVEGNVVIGSGDNCIQVTAGVIVRNNLVIGCSASGIAVQANQGIPQNVSITHNSVYVSGTSRGVYGSWSSTAVGFIIANNGIYAESGNPIVVSSTSSKSSLFN
jgi:hypothetical protein